MSRKCYFIYSSFISESYLSEESILFFDHREDVEEPTPIDELEFMTSVLVWGNDQSQLLSEFASWWCKEMGCEPIIDPCEYDFYELSLDRQSNFDQIEVGMWSFNSCFLAFRRGSPKGQSLARDFLMESELVIN